MKCVVSSALGCQIGPGQRIRLTDAQVATRHHALTVIDEKTGEVEPSMPMTFKRGEILNLPGKFDDLSSYLQSVLEPVAKAPAKEKTDSDRKAAADAAVTAAKAKLAAAAEGDKAAAQAELDAAETALAKLGA